MAMIPTAYTLAGFAIENAIKGVLTERLGTNDPFDRRVKDITSEDNMVALAKDEFPELIKYNEGLLEKLHDSSPWIRFVGGRMARHKG
jgi:hypothetical protein